MKYLKRLFEAFIFLFCIYSIPIYMAFAFIHWEIDLTKWADPSTVRLFIVMCIGPALLIAIPYAIDNKFHEEYKEEE